MLERRRGYELTPTPDSREGLWSWAFWSEAVFGFGLALGAVCIKASVPSLLSCRWISVLSARMKKIVSAKS